MEKICTRCSVKKTTNNFHKKGSGLHSICKACRKILSQKYYVDNKDEVLSRNRMWRKDNPEKYKDSNTRYYIFNRDAILRKKKKDYSIRREHFLEKARKYRESHRVLSLDYKAIDSIQFEHYKMGWDNIFKVECVADIYDKLSPLEIEFCEMFMRDAIDEIPTSILNSIRGKCA